jgi:hypothetical protein
MHEHSTTPEDRPEYIGVDVLEVFDPRLNAYRWIEVEDVLAVAGAQILRARGRHFCACWARTDSLALPRRNGGDLT